MTLLARRASVRGAWLGWLAGLGWAGLAGVAGWMYQRHAAYIRLIHDIHTYLIEGSIIRKEILDTEDRKRSPAGRGQEQIPHKKARKGEPQNMLIKQEDASENDGDKQWSKITGLIEEEDEPNLEIKSSSPDFKSEARMKKSTASRGLSCMCFTEVWGTSASQRGRDARRQQSQA